MVATFDMCAKSGREGKGRAVAVELVYLSLQSCQSRVGYSPVVWVWLVRRLVRSQVARNGNAKA